MYVMSIDAGTGSIRALIFDMSGKVCAIAQHEWVHKSEAGVPDSMRFDYDTGWRLTCKCIQEAIAKAGIDASEIAAVTASSMREGIVAYDKEGKEIFAVANVDARASDEVAYINERHPNLEREFYAISGQTFALGALPRLLWLKNNRPNLYERLDKINMISDWVLTKLSGAIVSEPSNASTSGIFSLKERRWRGDMAAKLGLKEDIFPETYESGTIIGGVSERASKECGLSVACKVVTGGGDVQLASAGLGIVRSGQSAILGGTFWQQIVNMHEIRTHESMDIRINAHIVKNLVQAEGITFFSGMAMRWFRDTFCEYEKMLAERERIDFYDFMQKRARDIPVGSHGILPIFSDAMRYGRWYHAAPSFLNLSLETTSKAAMFRSLMENAAIVSKINLENIYAFSGVSSERITFAGGASKGALWSQTLADVLGKEVAIPDINEATALGGAFLCFVALGAYGSIEEAAESLVRFKKTYEPDMRNYKEYEALAQRWQTAYAAQRALVDAGVTVSMWRAPGI